MNKQREVAPPREGAVSSQALLGRRGRLLIRHRGRVYELRQTRSGKLILTA